MLRECPVEPEDTTDQAAPPGDRSENQHSSQSPDVELRMSNSALFLVLNAAFFSHVARTSA